MKNEIGHRLARSSPSSSSSVFCTRWAFPLLLTILITLLLCRACMKCFTRAPFCRRVTGLGQWPAAQPVQAELDPTLKNKNNKIAETGLGLGRPSWPNLFLTEGVFGKTHSYALPFLFYSILFWYLVNKHLLWTKYNNWLSKCIVWIYISYMHRNK